LALEREVSVLVARDAKGHGCVWPLSENVHRDGILLVSRAPALVSDELTRNAHIMALTLATRLEYVGVMCVEFFVLADGSLRVNEMAPRPHNSGHYTLNASTTSQFEQQARILAGWPLGSTRLMGPSVMLNVLGDLWFVHGARAEPDWSVVLRHPQAKLHLYGKALPKPGRKMGHVTVVDATLAECQNSAAEIARELGIADSLPWAEGAA